MLLLLPLAVPMAVAQRPAWQKMSPLVRQAALEAVQPVALRSPSTRERALPRAVITAFVRVGGDGQAVLRAHGCRELLRRGDLFVAEIPLTQLAALSREEAVSRIEAGGRAHVLMDSTRMQVDALPVYAGTSLPQAFDGTGVVVGIQDIGFDLTHPTFWSRDMSRYRIRALWDQLSTDTLDSALPAGRDYVGEDALLALGCSRDGLTQTHGTHTSGIAAGSGFDSPYQGMAPGSDLCLVANATTDNAALIDSACYYKYTYALDALGFKYIFDYADAHGQPCVINFSEGSSQDFHGYDQLYYAMLDSLCGAGHILVASAGNEGGKRSFFRKPEGEQRAGAFIRANGNHASFTLKSDRPFTLLSTIYGSTRRTVAFDTRDILADADSTVTDTATVDNWLYFYNIDAYPCSYDSTETCYDVYIVAGSGGFGWETPVSFEVVGADADVCFYDGTGSLYRNGLDATLVAGESSHNIHSPSSAPCVISVGASSYKTSFVNYKGETHVYNQGTNGHVAGYSSRGPTYDGRTKPDVVAPGTNIVSSYSSYYLENQPDAGDINSDVAHFDYHGRTYAWNSNAGTSMAAPVVTGAIALWLQACPDLTPDDIKDVLAHTASHDDATLAYPNNQYGYGQIDVYKGLLYLLGIDGISGISHHQPSAVDIRAKAGSVVVTFDDVQPSAFEVRLWTVGGRQAAQWRPEGGRKSYVLPLEGLQRGVYVVQVNGGTAATTGSSLVRW